MVVSQIDAPAAVRALDGFDEEVDALAVRQLPLPPERPSSLGLLFAALIGGLYLVTGPVDLGTRWFDRGGALSEQILHGELYRTVTALCLHANFAHVFANAAFAVLLAGAVGHALGGGIGGLALLLSGALGNLATAVWYRTGHASIGASTAVFGAVGILAAPGAWRRGSRFPAWVAIGASLAFLGMVGTDRQADVVAHVAGLGAGLLLGVLGLRAEKQGLGAQAVAGVTAVAIFGVSWGFALLGNL